MSEEIKKLEVKAQALQQQAAELDKKIKETNIEFIKILGAIEYLKGVNDEA
jgi:prefoldin subunit 5